MRISINNAEDDIDTLESASSNHGSRIGSLETTVSGHTTAISYKANDNAVVKLTGAQSVAGSKTFTDPIVSKKHMVLGSDTGGVLIFQDLEPAANGWMLLGDETAFRIRKTTSTGGMYDYYDLMFHYRLLIFGLDNAYSLGNSGYRFGAIYLGASPIVTSDERLKTNIAPINDSIKRFLLDLEPVSYEVTDTDKEPGERRTHTGLVAQQVEQALYANGLNLLDFAGLIISPIEEEYDTGEVKTFIKTNDDGEEVRIEKPVMGKRIVDSRYGMRYEELIAPMLALIQDQQKQIDELTKRVDALSK
jgi:hypothetical protein